MVSIIVPCYNEAESLPILVKDIFAVLGSASIEGEVIVVDDNSPDGTGDIAEDLKKDYNVEVVHRKGKEGLSSAVVAGFAVAKGDIWGVMDADLSHDTKILPKMIRPLEQNLAQVAIGSRHVKGGGSDHWPFIRRLISKTAIIMGRTVTDVKDVTSGFFLFRKEVINGIEINPIGFKIGLEIFVKGNYEKFIEVPFIFKDRLHGESKLGKGEVVNYLKHLKALMKYNAQHKAKKRPTALKQKEQE